MAWGELVRWDEERGFGFVRSDYPAMDDVFVHRLALLRAGIEPRVGTALEFEVQDHKGRPRVVSAKRLSTWRDPDVDPTDKTEKLPGRIAHINVAKRFAFVARDDIPGTRVFVRYNDLGKNGVPAVIGAPVMFEVGERGGKPCVIAIEPFEQRH
ncbi:hypothetical protein HAP47_0021780 [Bradyrhizobium sp. 41S5]|uniref:cold-shock protein n=1 Tax=Bradyrhizobium sp. 41S5 TaxID=1404443 RepID=UPI00156B7FFB|nr:hypothetical protein [Bradyrhizobium sp. 41S5]UFX41930.1 hypothetical protein HAP47_0021780 [Bradyrhizobium sp. 41S5]